MGVKGTKQRSNHQPPPPSNVQSRRELGRTPPCLLPPGPKHLELILLLTVCVLGGCGVWCLLWNCGCKLWSLIVDCRLLFWEPNANKDCSRRTQMQQINNRQPMKFAMNIKLSPLHLFELSTVSECIFTIFQSHKTQLSTQFDELLELRNRCIT